MVHLAKQIVLILSMTFLFKYVNTDTTMACIIFCLLICSLYRYSWNTAYLTLNNNQSVNGWITVLQNTVRIDFSTTLKAELPPTQIK